MSSSDSTGQTTQYSVFVVFCKQSVPYIKQIVEDETGYQVDFARVIYKQNVATNGTLIVCPREAYNILCKKQYNVKKRRELFIDEYRVAPSCYPEDPNERRLFVPFPNPAKALSDAELGQIISAQMDFLLKSKILPVASFKLAIPLETARNGFSVKNGCYITFADSVSLEQIAITRMLLNDTYWPETITINGALAVFHCYWMVSYDSNGRRKRSENSDDDVQQQQQQTSQESLDSQETTQDSKDSQEPKTSQESKISQEPSKDLGAWQKVPKVVKEPETKSEDTFIEVLNKKSSKYQRRQRGPVVPVSLRSALNSPSAQTSRN